MKHAIAFVAAIALFAGVAHAQPGAITAAWNHLQQGNYGKAIEFIEKAAKHEKTINKAKTWDYRGRIYQGLFQSNTAADKELKKKYPNCLQTAVESYLKAKTLDTRRIDVSILDRSLKIGGQQLVNEGIGEYNDKDYAKALTSFQLATQAATNLNMTDSLAHYNAALAAEKVGNSAEAIKHYQKCIDINYGGAKVYYFLANLYLDGGDDAKFNETINAGREKYPDDQSLITAQINIYLRSEDSEKALGALNEAITNDPANASLLFARGTIKEKLGNLDDATGDSKRPLS